MDASGEEQREERRISREEWAARMQAADVPKELLKNLVMDYFVKRGFTKAAKAFQRESFTEPVKYGPEDEDKPIPVDLAELEPKSKVNQAVQDGEILKAIEVVNQLDPKILRDRPALNFKLHRERLLELVLADKVEEAINFAKDVLVPLGDGNPELIHTMEEVMALLLFTDRKQAEESVWGKSLGLDDEGQRRDNIAHEINSAIMNHQEGLEPDDFDPRVTEPKLHMKMKELLIKQRKLSEKGVKFPKVQGGEIGLLKAQNLLYDSDPEEEWPPEPYKPPEREGDDEMETEEPEEEPTPAPE